VHGVAWVSWGCMDACVHYKSSRVHMYELVATYAAAGVAATH
jgi:hypothetical protein